MYFCVDGGVGRGFDVRGDRLIKMMGWETFLWGIGWGEGYNRFLGLF